MKEETLSKNEAEVIELLLKASHNIRSLIKQNEYIKARAFEMLSGLDAQQKVAIYDPYPLADSLEKMGTYLQMKNTGTPFKP